MDIIQYNNKCINDVTLGEAFVAAKYFQRV